MTQIRFIGDTHAKFDRYQEIALAAEYSIQVGDFGAGFGIIPDLSSNHRFIRGNHDNPEVCRNHPNWIPDGTVEGETFYLGGGFSLDRAARIKDRDWWEDEELSMGELYGAMDVYENSKPKIVVSHECPCDVAPLLFSSRVGRLNNPSRTSQALGSMLYLHRPEVWIFGHWHIPVDVVIEGTRFICLGELNYIDLEIG